MTETIYIQWGYATDAGKVRALNEDSLMAQPPLFFVADGMGGHAAGDIASRTVVEACAPLAGREVLDVADIQGKLDDAVSRMHAALAGKSGGSTVAGVAMAVQDDLAYWLVFNVGDSRVYRSTAAGLQQVSIDHSVVQELVDAGKLSSRDALTHADRHVVTRALSTDSQSETDYWLLPAIPNDRLLICSDGLTDELADDQIAAFLCYAKEPQAAADALVTAALSAGGRDNVTAVVVDVLAAWHGLGRGSPISPEATALAATWDEQKYGVTRPRLQGGAA